MTALPDIGPDFYRAAAPILILTLGSLISMLQGVSRVFSSRLAISTVLFAALTAAFLAAYIYEPTGQAFFDGAFLASPMVRLGHCLILAIVIGIMLLTSMSSEGDAFFRGEVVSLLQMVVMGMLVMVASDDLITLFIGLELSSIGLYALIGYIKPQRASQEGAIKYFILGSFATAILLFGFALLYAATGAMSLGGIVAGLTPQTASTLWVKMGALLSLLGFAFKLALVPFHIWSPDAYEAAPTSITALMATCTKIMILIVAMRFLASSMPLLGGIWLPALTLLAAASMIFGNLLALVQTSLKRTLAYSSIAHSGYMAIALTVLSSKDSFPTTAILFYLAGYALTSLLAFGVLMWLEDDKRQNLSLDDLAGLAHSHPWLAFAMTTALFSLAGMPPTVGFLGKFFIFKAALVQQHFALVIIGALGSTLALYYYLRIIVYMYMRQPAASIGVSKRSYLFAGLMLCLLLGTLLLGTFLPDRALEAMKPIVTQSWSMH